MKPEQKLYEQREGLRKTEDVMYLPAAVMIALQRLERAGFEAFVVGGAVRDALRGDVAKDWDITTNALPQQVQQVFSGEHLIETGLKHGTLTVVLDHEPLEITTYRVDGGYSDHRHPDSVSFTRSLKEDLLRRDFTMNALAYNPNCGVADYVGGREDLARGLVRCVGEPDRRFQEDGLRMLRALRFASVYEMQIEADTAQAIHRNRQLLRDIAAERIREELTKLLCGRGAARILREFADAIAVPIPELSPMFGFLQQNPHHDKDVWEHTLAAVQSALSEPILRWAALLHDAGKPDCFSLDEAGIGHFYAHAEKSAELAQNVLKRLRFDNATKDEITMLVRYHDLLITADSKPVKRLLSKFGEAGARALLALHRADTLAQASCCRSRLEVFDEAEALLDELLRQQSCFSLKDLAVNGNDMIGLGYRGKQIGTALQACLDAVLDEKLPNEKQALWHYARTLKSATAEKSAET